jgi:hypothetical protein
MVKVRLTGAFRQALSVTIVRHRPLVQNSISEDPAFPREEDTMFARPSQHPQTLASNDNGILTFRRNATAALSNIVCVATEAAGSISVTYIADGVLAITPQRSPHRGASPLKPDPHEHRPP